MKLQFVIQRKEYGTFWRAESWVASIDLADQFDSEKVATDTAQTLSHDLGETMRVILRGPQLQAEVHPTHARINHSE